MTSTCVGDKSFVKCKNLNHSFIKSLFSFDVLKINNRKSSAAQYYKHEKLFV